MDNYTFSFSELSSMARNAIRIGRWDQLASALNYLVASQGRFDGVQRDIVDFWIDKLNNKLSEFNH